MGEELTAAAHAEPAGQRGHVLVHCRVAQAESRGDLLLGVSLDEAGKRLTEPPGKVHGRRFGRADQRAPDERSHLAMEEREQRTLARDEVRLAPGPVKMEQADRGTAHRWEEGRQAVVDVARPEILVDNGGTVVHPIGDDPTADARDRLAGSALQSAYERIGGRPPSRMYVE